MSCGILLYLALAAPVRKNIDDKAAVASVDQDMVRATVSALAEPELGDVEIDEADVLSMEANYEPEEDSFDTALLEQLVRTTAAADTEAEVGAQSRKELKLWLSCRNLPNQLGDKIDPFLQIMRPGWSMRDATTRLPGVVTDIKNNDDNPVYDPVTVPFDFTQVEEVMITLWDKDGISANDKIGSFKVKLGELYFAMRDGGAQAFNIKKPNGQLVQAHGEPSTCSVLKAIVPVDEELTITFHGIKLAPKDNYGLFKSSDPYMKLFWHERGDGQEVLKTNHINRNTNPVWNPAAVKVEHIGNGDWQQDLFISVWDKDVGADDLIGECDIKAWQLLAPQDGGVVCDLAKAGKTGSQGKVGITTNLGRKPMELGDYLAAGVELDFSVAVDFTASNLRNGRGNTNLHAGRTVGRRVGQGPPTSVEEEIAWPPAEDPTGIYPALMSDYGIAIEQIGRVVEQYDTDKKYTMYAFGGLVDKANPGRNGTTAGLPGFSDDYEVPLDFWSAAAGLPEGSTEGADALLAAYTQFVNDCNQVLVPHPRGGHQQGCYYGPTNFAPVVRAALADMDRDRAKASQYRKHVYKVLVVLTDGKNMDMKQTMREIMNAATEPMSIVFIGVGLSDEFEQLQVLDGDRGYEGWERKAGAAAPGPSRDIVQFVNYPEGNPQELSRLTLQEIPTQMIDAFLGKDVPPASYVEINGQMHELPLQVRGKPAYDGITTYVEDSEPKGVVRA